MLHELSTEPVTRVYTFLLHRHLENFTGTVKNVEHEARPSYWQGSSPAVARRPETRYGAEQSKGRFLGNVLLTSKILGIKNVRNLST